jgi:hypothetical protein
MSAEPGHGIVGMRPTTAALFRASDQAGATTGQSLNVDAGVAFYRGLAFYGLLGTVELFPSEPVNLHPTPVQSLRRVGRVRSSPSQRAMEAPIQQKQNQNHRSNDGEPDGEQQQRRQHLLYIVKLHGCHRRLVVQMRTR